MLVTFFTHPVYDRLVLDSGLNYGGFILWAAGKEKQLI